MSNQQKYRRLYYINTRIKIYSDIIKKLNSEIRINHNHRIKLYQERTQIKSTYKYKKNQPEWLKVQKHHIKNMSLPELKYFYKNLDQPIKTKLIRGKKIQQINTTELNYASRLKTKSKPEDIKKLLKYTLQQISLVQRK